MHRSCRSPSPSLIKSICYPENQHFHTRQTFWGCVHEKTVYHAYLSKEETEHVCLQYGFSGLVVPPSHPFMRASPDGVVSFECCGSGVVEIKCPYSCRDKSFLEAASESTFFLEQNNRVLSLNQSCILLSGTSTNEVLWCCLFGLCGMERRGTLHPVNIPK